MSDVSSQTALLNKVASYTTTEQYQLQKIKIYKVCAGSCLIFFLFSPCKPFYINVYKKQSSKNTTNISQYYAF